MTGQQLQQANSRAGLNGCHNRAPFPAEHMMQAGWTVDGRRLMRPVPFRMSLGCQYQKDPMGEGQRDPRCAGCKWKEEGKHEG